MADTKFGFVLEINGQEIALSPKTALADVKAKGVEVELPPGTELRLPKAGDGLQGFINACSEAFGGGPVTLPTDLPAPLDKATSYLSDVEITITDFWIRFPPVDPTKVTDYRIGAYVASTPIKLLGDTLKLKGFSVQIAGGAGIKP
jgi:hypothetical protein